ncbi:Sulfotransferase 17 [Theobroma cacao]|uniref:Sulfotransferase n=1 Tax=Theobroma cacao TaxID=3641 RepID=A0A061F597_THECC|nr:Sulfotransferase 17 [Theobroma cacao]
MEPSGAADSLDKEEVSPEKMERVREFMSTLPAENGWRAFQPLCLYQGFWSFPYFLEGIILAQQHFKPKPGDIFVCSAPKSGTTWLKAVTFAIVTRKHFDNSSSPLLTKGPHHCVPTFVGFGQKADIREPGVPLIATHAPYPSLPKSVLDCSSDHCKIVCICREPKDAFVSMFHFAAKRRFKEIEPISLEEAFHLFCEGKSVFGPCWDHILEFWKASQERPDKAISDEEQVGAVQKIVDLCSFENLSNLEINKTGKRYAGDSEATNKSFFRKGKVGDWQNYLTMAQRLDKIMKQKLSGSGLTFELQCRITGDNILQTRLLSTPLGLFPPFKSCAQKWYHLAQGSDLRHCQKVNIKEGKRQAALKS